MRNEHERLMLIDKRCEMLMIDDINVNVLHLHKSAFSQSQISSLKIIYSHSKILLYYINQNFKKEVNEI